MLHNGDTAISKIRKFLEPKNELALETFVEVYSGSNLTFSSIEKREEFKRIWNKDLKQS